MGGGHRFTLQLPPRISSPIFHRRTQLSTSPEETNLHHCVLHWALDGNCYLLSVHDPLGFNNHFTSGA